MKVRYLKLKNWLILSLMGLLGLSACNSERKLAKEAETEPSAIEPREEMRCMYGVPTTEYNKQIKVDEPTPGDIKAGTMPRREQPVMYGVPTVDFQVKGKVVDSKGNPVKGVQVILLNNNVDADETHVPDTPYWDEYLRQSADTTDAEGSFECTSSDRPWESMRLLVRDVDGKRNGEFKNQVLTVEFPKDAEPGSAISNWKLGTKTQEVTVELSKE